MYKALTTLLAVAFLATAANGQTTLNLTVKACDGAGSSEVTVAPEADLPYVVVGVLGDSATQGLGTVGIDLLLHDAAGAILDLRRANPPSGLPMSNFAFPDGLNNPTGGVLDSAVGYGGTPSRGKLLQCGGAQNTILNPADSGTFLLGTPILNVAQPGSPEVLVKGTLMAPAAVGIYTLAIKATCVRIDLAQAGDSSDTLCTTDADCPQGVPDSSDDEVCKGHPFAMLIDADLGTHFSVVSAVIPEPTHLTITVSAGAAEPCAVLNLDPGASDPPSGSIDAGIAHLINDAGTVLTPQSVVLGFTGSPVGVAPGEFTVTQKTGGGAEVSGPEVTTVTPGIGNTAEIMFATRIAAGAWTKVSFNGGQYCIGSMPGDTNQLGDATAADIDALIDCLNDGNCEPWVCDVDRFGACTGADLATLVDVLNQAGTFTSFAPLGASLCP